MLIQYNPNEMVHIYAIFISFSTLLFLACTLHPIVGPSRSLARTHAPTLCSFAHWQRRKIDEQFIFNLWRFYASRNEPEILYVYIIIFLCFAFAHPISLPRSHHFFSVSLWVGCCDDPLSIIRSKDIENVTARFKRIVLVRSILSVLSPN